MKQIKKIVTLSMLLSVASTHCMFEGVVSSAANFMYEHPVVTAGIGAVGGFLAYVIKELHDLKVSVRKSETFEAEVCQAIDDRNYDLLQDSIRRNSLKTVANFSLVVNDMNCLHLLARNITRLQDYVNNVQFDDYFDITQDINKNFIDNLIASGIDINAQDCLGQTPLHLAVMYGQLDLVEYLLEHGADKSILDSDGNTAEMFIPKDPFGTRRYATRADIDRMHDSFSALR